MCVDWAVQEGWLNIVFEMDSKILYQALTATNKIIPWQIRGIIKDVKHKRANFESFFVNLVQRQANTCADAVVKAVKGGSLVRTRKETLKQDLRKFLMEDNEGFRFPSNDICKTTGIV